MKKFHAVPALILLLGAALRIGMLAQDVRLDVDEALYASLARRISLHGDALLVDAPLDKPPLALLAIAGSFSIFGPTEFAARLPDLAASVLSLAVFYALANRLYGKTNRQTVTLALLLLALSPLDLAFSATAFLDPLLTLWLLLACLFASQDQWLGAGLSLALAIATKQTALAFAPLILAIGVACTLRGSWRSWNRRVVILRLVGFAAPLGVMALLLVMWSSARSAPVDFWTLGAINNTPDRFIRANEVIPRALRWLEVLGTVTGLAPLLLLAFVPLADALIATKHRAALIDGVLGAFILAVLLGYWLLAFNTYDRYLHTLGPLTLLLVARGAVRFGRWLPWLVAVCMIPFVIIALRGELAVGGDRGQHTGIDQLSAAINTLPAHTVVYDYWLAWEFAYYLGDSTSQQIVFQPSPESLARSACTQPDPVYFAAPPEEADAWLLPLQERGGRASILFDGRYRLYKLDCSF